MISEIILDDPKRKKWIPILKWKFEDIESFPEDDIETPNKQVKHMEKK